jgi:hypothetical protein
MTITLTIPAPLVHQAPVVDSAARFKLVRAGRRGGKTRVMFTCAVAGHGPLDAQGVPRWKGLAQGYDVPWIVPEYGQANTIWEEEIKPRFEPIPGVRINSSKLQAQVRGMGTIRIVSIESMKTAIRGIGARLGGVIVDEAAWLDLQLAWQAVLRPALVDNEGWAIIGSTTNSGHDGNRGEDDRGDRLLPSFFNRLCGEVLAGERDEEWAHFYFTGYDNPKLNKLEMDKFVGEYTPGSVRLREEVYAELLTAGAGLAFPEYDAALVDRPRPPLPSWDAVEVVGGLDWGYATPGAAYVVTGARSGVQVTLGGEVYFNGPPREDWPDRLTPDDVGRAIARRWAELVADQRIPAMPEMIFADSQCWAETDGALTIASRIQVGLDEVLGDTAPILVPAPKGPGSRKTRALLLHELLRVYRSEDGTHTEGPTLHVAPDCHHWRRTVPRLPVDPKEPDGVDTKAEDHAFDAMTYALIGAWPSGVKPSMASLEVARTRAALDPLSRREAEDEERVITRLQPVRRGRNFSAEG